MFYDSSYIEHDVTGYETLQTNETNLPIHIDAIGRTISPSIALSLRFFELDLFSENSQRINIAMDRQWQANRDLASTSLFDVFEIDRAIDVDQQVFYATQSLNLFSQPISVRQIGQAEQSDAIPLWIIGLVLFFCAFLGFFLARGVLGMKGAKANVHNNNHRN